MFECLNVYGFLFGTLNINNKIKKDIQNKKSKVNLNKHES